MTSKMSLLGTSNQQFQDFEQKPNSQQQFPQNPIFSSELYPGQFSQEDRRHVDHMPKNVSLHSPGYYNQTPKEKETSYRFQPQLPGQVFSYHSPQNKIQYGRNGKHCQRKNTSRQATKGQGKAKSKQSFNQQDYYPEYYSQQMISKNAVQKQHKYKNEQQKNQKNGSTYYSDNRYEIIEPDPYAQHHYQYYDPQYHYWYGPETFNNSYLPQGFPQFRENSEMNAYPRYECEEVSRNRSDQMKSQNKLNQGFSNKNTKKLHKRKMLENVKQQIKQHKQHFSSIQWDKLLLCLHQILLQKQIGVQNLWQFMDSFAGSSRLKKGERIFSILSILQCQHIFDKLKEQQQNQKKLHKNKSSEIKKLLFKLVSPLA